MKKTLLAIMILTSIKVTAQFLPIANGDSISWTVKHEIWDMAMIEKLYYETFIEDNGIFHSSVYTLRSLRFFYCFAFFAVNPFFTAKFAKIYAKFAKKSVK